MCPPPGRRLTLPYLTLSRGVQLFRDTLTLLLSIEAQRHGHPSPPPPWTTIVFSVAERVTFFCLSTSEKNPGFPTIRVALLSRDIVAIPPVSGYRVQCRDNARLLLPYVLNLSLAIEQPPRQESLQPKPPRWGGVYSRPLKRVQPRVYTPLGGQGKGCALQAATGL